MASRKDQKEEARARRLAEEQAAAERARTQRRLRMLIGVVLAAVVVVGIAVVVSASGGTKKTGLQTGTTASKTATAVSALLAGIPQSGAVLGDPGAPVTVTYYGDLQCPACRDFTLGNNGEGWPKLVAGEVRSGKVKVVYKAFPTATRDAATFKNQQVAALAAGRQNRFWDFAELFYHEQGTEGTGYATEAYLVGLARQIPGLNVSKWQTARGDASLAAQVQSDESAGNAAGVGATPTLVFEGPKGKPVALTGGSYSDLQKAISAVS